MATYGDSRVSAHVIIEPDVFVNNVTVLSGCGHWHVRRNELRDFLRERFPHVPVIEYRNCKNREMYQSYGWTAWNEEAQDWILLEDDLWKTGFME